MATINATNTSKPVAVAQGGTGITSATPYAVLCAGTTSTGPWQSLGTVGMAGDVLTGNGPSALPSWQPSATSGGGVALISTTTVSTATELVIDSTVFDTALYTTYVLMADPLEVPGDVAGQFVMQVSADDGSTWMESSYKSGRYSNPYNSAAITHTPSTGTIMMSPLFDIGGPVGMAGAYNIAWTPETFNITGQCVTTQTTPLMARLISFCLLGNVNAFRLIYVDTVTSPFTLYPFSGTIWLYAYTS